MDRSSLGFLLCLVACGHAAIFNSDTRYDLWPKLFPQDPYVRVPVYIDSGRYDAQTLANINAAISQMNTDLTGCIQFLVVNSPTGVGRDFLYISPVTNTGVPSQTCGTVPGHLPSQNQAGQKLYIIPGTGPGQCGGSVRMIMGKLANALSLRNEYQRPDRPITVAVQNIATTLSNVGASMYAPYTAGTQVYALNTQYDYNSITQITPQTNANLGAAMFTNPGGQATPTLNRLSSVDCNGFKWRYNCAATPVCADPFGTGTNPVNPTNPIQPLNPSGQPTQPVVNPNNPSVPSGPSEPTDNFN